MSSNKNRVELINCSFSSCIINLTSEYIVLILLASIGGSVLNGAVELWGLNFKNELLYVLRIGKMDQEFLKFAISQGLFAALFVWLLIVTRKESKLKKNLLLNYIES